MPPMLGSLEIKGLAKRQVAEVAQRAVELGMTTEHYVKHLIEEDLAIRHRAKAATFAQIMGSAREVDEPALDQIVGKAKHRYHRSLARKR